MRAEWEQRQKEEQQRQNRRQSQERESMRRIFIFHPKMYSFYDNSLLSPHRHAAAGAEGHG